MEMLSSGAWSGTGVHGPEAFPAQPYLAAMTAHGIHWALEEREPGASRPT
jgi:hypothetical protein